jgi:hypothetical protein
VEMMDPNKMWEIIELVIKENVKENEAIKSFGSGEVIFEYFAISNNTLLKCRRQVDKYTLCYMSVPTLRIFIKEMISLLRNEAGVE